LQGLESYKIGKIETSGGREGGLIAEVWKTFNWLGWFSTMLRKSQVSYKLLYYQVCGKIQYGLSIIQLKWFHNIILILLIDPQYLLPAHHKII